MAPGERLRTGHPRLTTVQRAIVGCRSRSGWRSCATGSTTSTWSSGALGLRRADADAGPPTSVAAGDRARDGRSGRDPVRRRGRRAVRRAGASRARSTAASTAAARRRSGARVGARVRRATSRGRRRSRGRGGHSSPRPFAVREACDERRGRGSGWGYGRSSSRVELSWRRTTSQTRGRARVRVFAGVGALLAPPHRATRSAGCCCGCDRLRGGRQRTRAGPARQPGPRGGRWPDHWLTNVWIAPIGVLPLLFPDGRLPSPRWRGFLQLSLAALVLGLVGDMFGPRTLEGRPSHGGQPVPGPGRRRRYLRLSSTVSRVLFIFARRARMALRFRRSPGLERLQFKWFSLVGAQAAAGRGASFGRRGTGRRVGGRRLVRLLTSLHRVAARDRLCGHALPAL